MRSTWLSIPLLAFIAGALVAASAAVPRGSVDASGKDFEVWAFDQADTDTEAAGGGQLFIWDGAELQHNARRTQPDIIDLANLAVESDADCDIATRPHMALPNHGDPPTHVVVANVVSGDIHFIDVESRQIDGCIPDLGAAHAAVPSHDDEIVVVASIGEQELHKIATDYDNAEYELTDTLFLGTDEILGQLYPDVPADERDSDEHHARPICHEFDTRHGLAYVTLQGGGLLIVDAGSPNDAMEVVHVYPAEAVPGMGCGAFPLEDGRVVTNGESGQFGGDDYLFVFEPRDADGNFADPVTIELPGDDTHGLEICETHRGDLYAWTVMRVSNHINIIDLQNYEVVRTWSMERPWSPDPKPDLALGHDGSLFVTLRGPAPLSAIPALENPERTPGVGVFGMHRNCETFNWGAKDIAPMPNDITTELEDGTEVTTSDPHGIAIVPRE